jgi:nucleoside-diphosphate-sugar epimerase
MKKILVTGVGSYIGTSLVDWLRHYEGQYQVDAIDMQEHGWKSKSFSGYDAVFHVAGIAHIKETAENADLYYLVNRDLAFEAAQKAKNEGVRQFIFMSSMSVYGLRYGMIETDTIPQPDTHYGRSKLQAEELIMPLQSATFAVSIIRPPMIYGKECKGNYQKLSQIVCKIHVFPNFRNRRSMLYIDNLCEFLRHLIDSGASGHFYPQNKEYVCTADLVRLIAKSNKTPIFTTRIFNALIKLLYIRVNMFAKIFNDLTYNQAMSQHEQDYQVCSFANSVRLAEGTAINKSAVCISCFNYYDNRLRYISEYLAKKGYEVINITSDFDHLSKKRYQLSRPATIQVPVFAYKKNLSVSRIISHFWFSQRVYQRLRELDPDILYVMLPPNSLASVTARFRAFNPCTLIYDIYDLWPETFPNDKHKKLMGLIFRRWSALRDLSLPAANLVVTECDYYHVALRKAGYKDALYTLRLTKEGQANYVEGDMDGSRFEVCYLGSINNIIDIDTIVLFLKKMSDVRPVLLHIIGDGEARTILLSSLDQAKIAYVYHGAIFDPVVKSKIFMKCQYGLNIMKNSVYVGLTMKSIDYFMAGLPIINTIRGDTEFLVDSRQIGFNLYADRLNVTIEKMTTLSHAEWKMMKRRVLAVFEEEFSVASFRDKVASIMSQCTYNHINEKDGI